MWHNESLFLRRAKIHFWMAIQEVSMTQGLIKIHNQTRRNPLPFAADPPMINFSTGQLAQKKTANQENIG
jgi:hypothetical protein